MACQSAIRLNTFKVQDSTVFISVTIVTCSIIFDTADNEYLHRYSFVPPHHVSGTRYRSVTKCRLAS